MDKQNVLAVDKLKADSLHRLANTKITQNQLYQKDDEAALKLLNEAIEIAPYSYNYYLDRSAVKINLLLFSEALLDLEKVLKVEPKNERALVNAALCNNHLQEYDAAINYASRAIDVNANFGYAYYVRSDSWMSKNNFEEMCKDLNLAFENNYSPAANRISKFCNKTIKHIKF